MKGFHHQLWQASRGQPSVFRSRILVVAAALFVYTCVNGVNGEAAHKVVSILDTIPQAVMVNPLTYNVMGENATFRTNAFDNSSFFNPTSKVPPFFQVFDASFLAVLGENASIREIARNDTFAFAHEAPVYYPSTDEVFFASNAGSKLGMSDLEHNNAVSKISLEEAERALAVENRSVVNVPFTTIDLPETIQMTNGGTGPFRGSLAFVTSGRGPRPPSVALVNPLPPYNATVLLDNFYGRQFNSLNDIKIHPSGRFFFTDVSYGYVNDFRPQPMMPEQVYRFDPESGSIRVVADGFEKCNGIAFTQDGALAYMYVLNLLLLCEIKGRDIVFPAEPTRV
ncbi:hypothetical protein PM082_005473 [Marasmius tenuissimus]|nr:hypothetical protein PM082_005473 [Marasmius tenuissimus]